MEALKRGEELTRPTDIFRLPGKGIDGVQPGTPGRPADNSNAGSGQSVAQGDQGGQVNEQTNSFDTVLRPKIIDTGSPKISYPANLVTR
jgi:hypothetical protein